MNKIIITINHAYSMGHVYSQSSRSQQKQYPKLYTKITIIKKKQPKSYGINHFIAKSLNYRNTIYVKIVIKVCWVTYKHSNRHKLYF